MITQFKGELYRADTVLPPQDWTVNFKNPKYEYGDSGYGHKNTAGLFFFTDSIDDARRIGFIEADEAFKQGFYLTSLVVTEEINLIDFSKCSTIEQMLALLYSYGLDVLTDEFLTGEGQQKFSQVREHYFKIIDENDIIDKNELRDYMKKLIGLPDEHVHLFVEHYRLVSAFGQRLTDFNNGEVFKVLVKSSSLNVDGYKWKEGKIGFSYCLFEPSKLPAVKSVDCIG